VDTRGRSTKQINPESAWLRLITAMNFCWYGVRGALRALTRSADRRSQTG